MSKNYKKIPMDVIKKSAFFCLCLNLFSALAAQTGSIQGIITDSISHETLVGASVVIEGTSHGAVSDFDGKFVLQNVNPGSYNLIFTYISYRRKVISSVIVSGGQITNVNALLSSQNITIQEVQVVKHKLTSTDQSLLLEMKNNNLVTSGVSGEQINKNQDRNAAEVVKRISGVTILDDRFIMIRGLNDRYNDVWMNGAIAPSSETDRKSFSFDILPGSMIDRIIIYKTPSPELPGDFAGGLVKVFTKNHISNNFEFSITGGYRSGSSFESFTGDKSSTDWLGFDNGYRALPSNLPVFSSNLSNDEIFSLDQKFKNNWVFDNHKALPDLGLAATYSSDFKLFGKSISSVSSLNYSNSNSVFDMYRKTYNLNGNEHFNDNQYTNMVRESAIQNFQISLSPGNSITFNNLFNQNGRNRFTKRAFLDQEGKETEDRYAIWYQSRTVYNAQLIGNHSIHDDKTNIDWVLGYSFSQKDEPDLRRLSYSLNPSADSTIYKVLTPATGQVDITRAGRLYQKLNEYNYTAGANLKQKIKINDYSFVLNAGTYQEYKNRDFKARAFGYSPYNQINFQDKLQYLPINEIFAPQNVGSNGFELLEDIDPTYKYSASNFLNAFYVSADLTLSPKINLSGGLRYEHNDQQMQSTQNYNPLNTDVVTNFLLPSVHLNYNFTEKSVLRASYGKSVNRPEFREWAPFTFYDFDILAQTYGKLYLTPQEPLKVASIHNFDLRYEYYPQKNEIVSLAAFYKKLKDPIESTAVATAGNLSYTYDNAPQAYIYGVELDIRKSLGFLDTLFSSGIFRNFSLLVNASLIKSRVTIPTNTVAWSYSRPLQGQSPYVINTGLYYQNNKAAMSFSILYNLFGPRIAYVGQNDYPDVIEMSRNVLDININKKVSRTLDIVLGIKDLFNQPFIWLQDVNKDSKYDTSSDLVIWRYKPQSYYTLSLKWHF